MRRSLAALGSLEGDTSNRWFTLAKWQLGGGTAELAAVAVTVKGTKKGGQWVTRRKRKIRALLGTIVRVFHLLDF